MTRLHCLACALGLLLAGHGGAAGGLPEDAAEGLRHELGSPRRGALAAELAAASLALDRLRGNLDPGAHQAVAAEVARLAAIAPGHPRVLALRAWLEMNRHRFADALALADQALAAAPREPVARLLRADALTELGRYEEAVVAVDELGEAGATVPVVIRIAHLRRLHGDLPGALDLVTGTLAGTALAHPDRPWLVRELAALHWHAGQAGAALALLRDLPATDLEGLVLRARILEADGPSAATHDAWRQAAAAAPLPGVLLGLWRTAPDAAERRRLAHRLQGMARLDEAQGGLARRDYVEFLARSGALGPALELARREYERRPDVFSAAQLGWVLALAGYPAEAAERARGAARLGTRDRDLEAQVGQARPAGPGLAQGGR